MKPKIEKRPGSDWDVAVKVVGDGEYHVTVFDVETVAEAIKEALDTFSMEEQVWPLRVERLP